MESFMTCPSEEILVDLTYEELEPLELARLKRHVEGCTACTVALSSIQEALELAGEFPGFAVSPNPEIEVRLKALVTARKPWYIKIGHGLGTALRVPIPAYQAILGGAALAIALLFVGPPPASEQSAALSSAPRAPDPTARTIPIQPIHATGAGYERLELRHALGAIEPDGYAQAY